MKTLQLLKIYSLISLFAILTVFELISLFFLHETGSLVLLLDSYHNFFTLLSLVLLVISHKLTYARTLKNTFGWARMGILGTMVNLIFFCALLFSLAVHCIQTMAHAEHEQVQPQNPFSLIILGSVGIVMYFILQITAGDLMSKGSGYVTITGNDLIFNCVLPSSDQSEHLALQLAPSSPTASPTATSATATTSGQGDITSSTTGTVINRRKICTSSAYKCGTNGDSSDTRGELEHILCDSNDNEQPVDNRGNFAQAKGEASASSSTSGLRMCTLIRDYTSSFTLVITGLILISSSYLNSPDQMDQFRANLTSNTHADANWALKTLSNVTTKSNEQLVTSSSNNISSVAFIDDISRASSSQGESHHTHEDELHEWHHKIYHSPNEQLHNFPLAIADAVLAFICCIIFAFTLYPSMKEYSLILLQSLPKNIDVKLLKKSLLKEFSGSVLSIHDLHIWSHTPSQIIATCHVSLALEKQNSYVKLLNQMEEFFTKQGITSSTIQPEFHDISRKETSASVHCSKGPSQANNSFSCLYSCSNHSNCKEFQCCKTDEVEEDAKGCHEDEAQVLISS